MLTKMTSALRATLNKGKNISGQAVTSVASNPIAQKAAEEGSALKRVAGKAIGINGLFGIWQGVDEYQSARENGDGFISSVGQGAFEGVLGMYPWLWAGYHGLKDGPRAIVEGVAAADTWRRNLARSNSNQAFVNAQFEDTQQVHTMRQAGMAIAQRSRYNTQVAMMGNEAQYMMK